ncbi:hypothetical protein EW145_g581 [Phellinidium pouzarii]|uniref:Uncharacterized protein n=1 Tax=Phellinidium pouzarii TaxID=167371 RepID=A0A4S4LI08_9AGAM|nr:hypothetical protein EW145_g581 [Phellinidium pouzarii]
MPGLRALTILLLLVILCLTRAQNGAPTSTLNIVSISDGPPTTTDHAIVHEPIASAASGSGTPKPGSISQTASAASSHSSSTALKSHSRINTTSHSAVSSSVVISFSSHHTLQPGHTVPVHGLNGSAGHTGAGQQRSAHHRSQSAVAIVFEALGGFAGLLIVLGCGHCLYHYHRTPRYDGVSAAIDRHNLDRELAEMEEALPVSRASYVLPPPPYQGAPKYEDVAQPADQLPERPP